MDKHELHTYGSDYDIAAQQRTYKSIFTIMDIPIATSVSN